MKSDARVRGVFLIIGLFISLGFFAQNAVLEGRIYSRESFENISHANLILRNSDGMVVTSITTGFDGRYKTDSLEAGAYKIEVFSDEFVSETIEVVYLQPHKSSRIDISMSAKSHAVNSEDEPTEVVSSEEYNPGSEKPAKKFKLFEILGDIVKTGVIAGL